MIKVCRPSTSNIRPGTSHIQESQRLTGKSLAAFNSCCQFYRVRGRRGNCRLIVAVPRDSGNARRAKPLGRSCARFQSFSFAISGSSIRYQRIEQFLRDLRHASDGASESLFVSLGRFGEAAELSNELKRRRPNFFLRSRWREVMQCFDVSTHKISFLLSDKNASGTSYGLRSRDA
jgi:hypothetical protein